jgi:hypothetical protein
MTEFDFKGALNNMPPLDGKTVLCEEYVQQLGEFTLCAYRDIKAALALATRVQSGELVVVPSEPTDEMFVDPDEMGAINYGQSPWSSFVETYKKIIAAAPKHDWSEK